MAFSHSGSPPASEADSGLNLEVPNCDETDSSLEPAVTGAWTRESRLSGWARPTCLKTSGRRRSTTIPTTASEVALGRAQPLLGTLTVGEDLRQKETPFGPRRQLTGTGREAMAGGALRPLDISNSPGVLCHLWLDLSWSSSILPGWPHRNYFPPGWGPGIRLRQILSGATSH